ncbi:MAG: UvrB/UvrC motif-containing protein [Planctomycetes bacterium]|jgi:protein arginine kinase activator|nr:UvrB/UvrC motif-containing protein [Planctomycetota bacterium]
MKCQTCDETATVHMTEIVNGKKREKHYCQDCARKQQLLKQQDLNLTAILQSVIGQNVGEATKELAQLTCPTCGIKYMEFKAAGRCGCPDDYVAFREPLMPLLERIHRGRRHVGKIPVHALQHAAAQTVLLDLRQQLRNAVEREAYEDAARLRDLIRQKEHADEHG